MLGLADALKHDAVVAVVAAHGVQGHPWHRLHLHAQRDRLRYPAVVPAPVHEVDLAAASPEHAQPARAATRCEWSGGRDAWLGDHFVLEYSPGTEVLEEVVHDLVASPDDAVVLVGPAERVDPRAWQNRHVRLEHVDLWHPAVVVAPVRADGLVGACPPDGQVALAPAGRQRRVRGDARRPPGVVLPLAPGRRVHVQVVQLPVGRPDHAAVLVRPAHRVQRGAWRDLDCWGQLLFDGRPVRVGAPVLYHDLLVRGPVH
mmetsp:Transcript_113463/g.308180  ORF Transcript_113463/g.308180 Transcript_113463/m.308180 type:complete len:258 (+) Transcript_113463:334-1107(+)